MKKFIFILSILILTTTFVGAAEFPRWVGQPITVYIPEYGNYSKLMYQSFNTWEEMSNDLIRFRYVDSPESSQIQVEFVDFVTNCSNNHAVGCTQLATRGKNYYKSIVTIGTKEYAKIYNGAVYTQKLRSRSKKNIYGVMLHEVGHALGLNHSKNPKSIMYPYDLPTLQYLTKSDMNLLYRKYH